MAFHSPRETNANDQEVSKRRISSPKHLYFLRTYCLTHFRADSPIPQDAPGDCRVPGCDEILTQHDSRFQRCLLGALHQNVQNARSGAIAPPQMHPALRGDVRLATAWEKWATAMLSDHISSMCPATGRSDLSASQILNCVGEDDAVDLLSTQPSQRESEIDDHPPGRVECGPSSPCLADVLRASVLPIRVAQPFEVCS